MSNLQQSIAAVSGRFKSKSLSNQIPQWSILPQESSPLFIALPTEIRLQIFCYALTEDQVPYDRDGQRLYSFKEPDWKMRRLPDDTREPDLQLESAGLDEAYVPYSEYEIPGGDWLRPGTRGRKIQHTSILRTCRRVFVEARDMLMENATIRFFEGDYNTPPNCDHGRVMDMFTMPRYTANRLTSFHLFIPVHLLEHGYLFQRSLDMSPARDIRITIRLCDWWETDPSAPQLTPFGTGCVNRFEPIQMKEHMKLTEDSERSNTCVSIPPIPFSTGPRSPRGAWGAALSQFPRLQRFTMDFEYSEDGFDGLLELAEWAHRVWRFRLGGAMKGYYLSTAGIPIKKTTWRGLSTHWRATNWRHKAMHTQRLAAGEEEDYLAPCCARRRALQDKVIGPQMYTFTVTWTARKLEPEDGFDHSILGPEALSGQWNELPTDGVAEPLSLDDWYSGGLPSYGLLHPNRTSAIDQPQY
ncbi:hypothetical protein AK830_g2961 [Neonectria ditissima]|uniref:Uncharacterized protein n=1 Tax=Neonectria ditissima TaxID=78410 RepID=A0A0P7BR17_9HYPO|nr:hypothetical protein AK830_g2961 [Neonectria ditissima]